MALRALQDGAMINALNVKGYSVLGVAVQQARSDMVRFLIQEAADIELKQVRLNHEPCLGCNAG